MQGKVTRWAVAFLLALALAVPEPQQQPVQASNPGGRLEQVAASPNPGQDGPGLLLLSLRGTPYEMGLQQGTLLRQTLQQLVRDYLHGQVFSQGFAVHWGLLNYARLVDRESPTNLRREMLGIAHGAGLSYQDILLLNVLPDLLNLTSQMPSWDLSPAVWVASAQGATLGQALRTLPSGARTSPGNSFAVWGTATQSGELFVGQNLGPAIPELAGHWLLVVRQPEQGNASISLSPVGSVGAWAGMNEEKIVVALSSSASADIAPLGQPLPFLLRQILQVAGSLDQASNALLGARRLCGGDVLIADGKAPDALAIELSAHRQDTFQAVADGGWLARTNHYVADDLTLIQDSVLSSQERTWSEDRLARSLAQLRVNSGWIGPEKAVALLRRDRDDLLGRSYPTDCSLCPPETVYSVLFCPDRLTAWVMQGDTTSWLDLNSTLLKQP